MALNWKTVRQEIATIANRTKVKMRCPGCFKVLSVAADKLNHVDQRIKCPGCDKATPRNQMLHA